MELNNINYWPGQSGYDYHITQQIAAWSRLSAASIYRGRPPRYQKTNLLSIRMALGLVCITLGMTGDQDKWDNCTGDQIVAWRAMCIHSDGSPCKWTPTERNEEFD